MDTAQKKQVKIGAALMVIGVMLLAQQLHIDVVWRLWPLAMIVLGLPRLLTAGTSDERAGGIWLTSLGVIFLLHSLRLASLKATWPLFLVPVGLALLLPADAPKPTKAE
jgi:hypothetical protein